MISLLTPRTEHLLSGRALTKAIASDAPAPVIKALHEWRIRTREALSRHRLSQWLRGERIF
jgi:hypothetical protein